MCNSYSNRMHPRNVFSSAPDYTELAIQYAEFRKVCKLALNGKVIIDLKSEESLRSLTTTLLLHYFDLIVKFAPNSLIPTLPLRLNYILWIEDIVNYFQLDNIHGIDIGCGSSCIYALLAAKKNNWKMTALEANEVNIQYAQDNVERNKLQDYVRIFSQSNKNVILTDFLNTNSSTVFDFCLCNPPFYDIGNYQKKIRTQKEKRKEPKNVPTGNVDELYCEGGEIAFVERIIAESQCFANQVKVFTTMLGHKSSVPAIVNLLNSKGIENMVTTEFCQGNTTRWGVAWSFESKSMKNVQSI